MLRKSTLWLLGIFLAVLALRLTLAFLTPNFTYDSYFHLRQVQHITETGLPLYQDPLSYGGRSYLFLPFFHYLAALFALFLPLELVAKILPNLLLATLPLIIYLLGKKITKNSTASLFSAFIAGFLPAVFYTHSFTPETLVYPLIFLALYAFLNISQKKYFYLYLLLFFLLCFTTSLTLILLLAFCIYFLLNWLEAQPQNPAELELVLFSLFFFLWTQFLFFKEFLLKEGLNFIWLNVPSAIINQYFPQVSFLMALLLISVIPFLAGIFVVYRSLFYLKEKKIFLVLSFTFSTAILLSFRLIPFKISLVFLGLTLALLFASFYQDAIKYFQKTKIHRYIFQFNLLLILLLLLTVVPPAINSSLHQEIPSSEEVAAFQWLQNNTPESSGVASLLEEGSLISYYGQRKNLMDERFELVPNIERRFASLNALFTTSFQTQALRITDDYKINYIVVTPSAKEKYNITNLAYYSPNCFSKVYPSKNETTIETTPGTVPGTVIYKVDCTLEETRKHG